MRYKGRPIDDTAAARHHNPGRQLSPLTLMLAMTTIPNEPPAKFAKPKSGDLRQERRGSGSGRSDEEVNKRSSDCGGSSDENDGPPAKFAKSGDAKSKRREEERNKWNAAFGIGKGGGGGAGGLLSGIYTADEGQRKLLDRLREKQRQAEEKMEGDVVADESRRKWGWVKVGTKWCTKG